MIQLPEEIISKIMLYHSHPIADTLNKIYKKEYGKDYKIKFMNEGFIEIRYPSYFKYYIYHSHLIADMCLCDKQID